MIAGTSTQDAVVIIVGIVSYTVYCITRLFKGGDE